MLRPTPTPPPPYAFLPVPSDHIMARMQLLPVKIPGSDWAFYAKTFSRAKNAIRDKHSNEPWNWFVKSSNAEALSPVLENFRHRFSSKGRGWLPLPCGFPDFFSKTIKHQHLKLSIAICLSLARILRQV